MRAAVTEAFGGVDRVVVREVAKPAPGAGEVLVRVRAAAMNPLDGNLREGRLRFIYWLKPPFVLGVDVAGEVEAVGPGVTRTRPGEAVFGGLPRPGAHAQYAVAGEDHFLPKPGGLSFEEAAAIPVAGTSALQALRDDAGLRAGQRVLVNGAGGGVGTFAVQIAKAWGTCVTAMPLFGARRCRALMLRPRRVDLEELVELVEAGKLRPVVGHVFPLEAIREAHLRMQSGHALGKIVVRP